MVTPIKKKTIYKKKTYKGKKKVYSKKKTYINKYKEFLDNPDKLSDKLKVAKYASLKPKGLTQLNKDDYIPDNFKKFVNKINSPTIKEYVNFIPALLLSITALFLKSRQAVKLVTDAFYRAMDEHDTNIDIELKKAVNNINFVKQGEEPRIDLPPITLKEWKDLPLIEQITKVSKVYIGMLFDNKDKLKSADEIFTLVGLFLHDIPYLITSTRKNTALKDIDKFALYRGLVSNLSSLAKISDISKNEIKSAKEKKEDKEERKDSKESMSLLNKNIRLLLYDLPNRNTAEKVINPELIKHDPNESNFGKFNREQAIRLNKYPTVVTDTSNKGVSLYQKMINKFTKSPTISSTISPLSLGRSPTYSSSPSTTPLTSPKLQNRSNVLTVNNLKRK